MKGSNEQNPNNPQITKREDSKAKISDTVIIHCNNICGICDYFHG